jgi:hypothetical protein
MAFLRSIDRESELKLLEDEGLTLRLLPKFSEQELREMGIRWGPAKEISLATEKYKISCSNGNGS